MPYLQWQLNSLRLRPNRRHFADDIFKCIFENENEWISPKISLKFVPKGPITNIPALVQIMAWRLPGDKPLSEPLMVTLPTHICVTRPQWVNSTAISVTAWISNYIPQKTMDVIHGSHTSGPTKNKDFSRTLVKFIRTFNSLTTVSGLLISTIL